MSFAFSCCCGCKCPPVWAEYWENVTVGATACGSPPPAPDPLPAGTYYQDGNLYSRCVRGVHSTSEASPGVVKIELEGAKLVQLHKGFDRAGAEEFWPYGASAPGLGGPLEATVTDDWWDGSEWRSTILVPGAATAAASGDVALYLNAAQCDHRGWKGVCAEGVYIGVPALDYGTCGETCVAVAPRHYLSSRMTGDKTWEAVDSGGLASSGVDFSYDQRFTLDADTGALSLDDGSFCSGYTADMTNYLFPVSYCAASGVLYGFYAPAYTEWWTDVLESPGWPDWECLDAECMIQRKFKWTLERDEATGDLVGMEYDYAFRVSNSDGSSVTDNYRSTLRLSNTVQWDSGSGNGVYPETVALLDQWALSGCYQFPWRTDTGRATVPVVRRDTSSDNLLPVAPLRCDTMAGETWPKPGGTGDLVGQPLPNSATRIYGPHKQFRPPLCTSVPPDAPSVLPLSATYWRDGTQVYYGAFNHYQPSQRLLRVQKFALAFAGCGIGDTVIVSGAASGNGWTGTWEPGYAHASGYTDALEVFDGSDPVVPRIDRSYLVSAMVNPTPPATAVAGSLSVSLGGVTSGALTIDGVVIKAETAAPLKFVPTSAFDGTVSFIAMSPYPQGDFGFVEWVYDGCAGCPTASGFSCLPQRIPQPRCGGVVGCVSNTPGDVWNGSAAASGVSGVTIEFGEVGFQEFTRLGQCSDGITDAGAAGWFCQPWFDRAEGYPGETTIEYRCDDCLSCSGAACSAIEPRPDGCPINETGSHQAGMPDRYWAGLPQYGDPLLEVPI